jgi:alpha-glutamyl/putrescinyl thymine pyrophosphorylase clade 1
MTLGNAGEVAHWITQREQARKFKESGMPRPWCEDKIINEYRFCNVRREDDKVTRWLKKHWRDPYKDHPNLPVAMLLARMINWPPTLDAMGFPDKWDPDKIVEIMHALDGKVWTSAYVITTCGRRMDKAQYVVGTVCNAMYVGRVAPRHGDTLEAFWTRLRAIDGLGAGFIAAQVVADLKNIVGTPLSLAEDWWTWAVPGPGSRRGVNRYFDADTDARQSDHDWKHGLDVMISEVQPLIMDTVGRLHAQDWQNVMCEYDKWKRVKHGEGRPRQRYSADTSYSI